MAGFEWYSMLSAGSENGLEKRLARLARAGCAGVFAVPAYEENSLNDDRGLRFAETMIRLCRAAVSPAALSPFESLFRVAGSGAVQRRAERRRSRYSRGVDFR